MTGIVDWAAGRARMVIAFIVLSLVVGAYCYVSLPKEGEPDIEIPALFVSVPFPGISAEDSETLLVQPMETELADLDGLKTLGATAAEGYGFAGEEESTLEWEIDFTDPRPCGDLSKLALTGTDSSVVSGLGFASGVLLAGGLLVLARQRRAQIHH